MLNLVRKFNPTKTISLVQLIKPQQRFYATKFWDLKTERAQHHQYKPNPDPLYFCLKPKGKISSKKKEPLKKFAKYRMPNHKGMLTRLKVVGPAWNRQFKIKQAGIERRRRNHSR